MNQSIAHRRTELAFSTDYTLASSEGFFTAFLVQSRKFQ